MQAFPPARNVILPNTSRVSHRFATNIELAGDSQVRVDAWDAGLLERAGQWLEPPRGAPRARVVAPQRRARVARAEVEE